MNSIRRHLLTSLLVGLTVVLGAAGTAVFFRTRAVVTSEFDVALRAEAAIVMSDTEYDEDGKVGVDADGSVRPDVYYQAWLPDGQIVARSPNLEFNDLPQREGELKLPDGRPGRAMLFRFTPQPAEDEQPVIPSMPAVALVVARDRVALDRTLAGIAAGLLLVGVLVLALTALVVTFAIRHGLTPVDDLGRQIAVSTLQTRFAMGNLPAELRPIVERLNGLLARLDEAFQRERRVTADIAHELRTPIAELRALAEVGAKWPDETSFQDALQIAQRMETMVTGLLALARHEAGQQLLVRDPVTLAKLVDEIWQPFAERAQQLDVTIDVSGTWQTDPTLLRLIIANLLENAVEYTPVQGKIRVSGSNSRFEVTNTTNSLTPEDMPHLFERFWRKDAARADAGHSGLGLAVAQSAATALGLKLTADMPETGTLRLTLRGGV